MPQKRILIGWLANWNEVKNLPSTSWTNQMTIPRELGLANFNGEIVLTQKPICDVFYELKVKTPTSGIIGLKGFVKVGFCADKKVIFFDMMIDIAEKEYQIDIRKNSSPEQSTILNKKNNKQ